MSKKNRKSNQFEYIVVFPPLPSTTVSAKNAGQSPYQGSLQKDRKHFCGCAIISSTWVLTAGHCLRLLVDQWFFFCDVRNSNVKSLYNKIKL